MEGNFFSGSVLDRATELRTNYIYLVDALKNDTSKYILFQNCDPLVEEQGIELTLVTFSYHDIRDIGNMSTKLSEKDFEWPENLLYLGKDGSDANWFAININRGDSVIDSYLNDNRSISRGFIQDLLISWRDSSIVSQAKSMFHWLDRYRFCPTCGGRMHVDDAGYKRTCNDKTCRSNKGVHNTCYPRTDPTAIMCVVSKDGEKCLLGRKKSWPSKKYSCLAGFMEPGECIEEAVKRETKEESGVLVEDIQYISSQPWPFPSSLMIGCLAKASTDEIIINEEEMEDVQWFEKEVVEKALRGRSDSLNLPPKQAIAHQLLKHWITTTTPTKSVL